MDMRSVGIDARAVAPGDKAERFLVELGELSRQIVELDGGRQFLHRFLLRLLARTDQKAGPSATVRIHSDTFAARDQLGIFSAEIELYDVMLIRRELGFHIVFPLSPLTFPKNARRLF